MLLFGEIVLQNCIKTGIKFSRHEVLQNFSVGTIYSLLKSRKTNGALFLNHRKFTGNLNHGRIKEILECTSKEASSLVRKCRGLQQENLESTMRIMDYLKIMGAKGDLISKNINIFEIPHDELLNRIQLLEELGYTDLNSHIQLLHYPCESIRNYSEVMKCYGKKIIEFAKLVACSDVEACHLFKKHRFLMMSKVSTLREKVLLMTGEGGITAEDIRRDLWVLSYTLKKLENRLVKLKELGITPLKPWMLRCDEHIIQRTVSNRVENKAAMAPYTTSKDYFCQRLSISPQQFQLFVAKHPPVMRVQVSKVREMIDFLVDEGFTVTQIYHTPRILCHSITTIQKRLNVLRERRYEPHTLHLLCRSQRIFDEFIKKLSTRQ